MFVRFNSLTLDTNSNPRNPKAERNIDTSTELDSLPLFTGNPDKLHDTYILVKQEESVQKR